MKRFLPIMVALAAFSLISFSGGLSSDATGGPVSGGQYCGVPSCHGGSPGNFDPSLQIQLLDGEEAITEYTPGETYRLRVQINAANGTPGGYGFQAVALDAEDAGIGSFSNPGDDVRNYILNERHYATHSTRSATNSFEIDWTAPAAGAGAVNFWIAGNAVNANGSNSGDNPVRTETPVTINEEQATSVREIASISSWSVFPNPVGSTPVTIHLDAVDREQLNLRVVSMDGKSVFADRWVVQAGNNTRTLNLSDLPGGHYSVQLWNNKGVNTQTIVKK